MQSQKPKVLMSWSTGKDSAWALHTLRSKGEVEVAGLLTTLNQTVDRVSMHGVRDELLQLQAETLGLPITRVLIPDPCTNEDYENAMGAVLEQAKRDGVTGIAFGDLFLEDIRRYREEKLAPTGLDALFPIWGSDTRELANEMVESGVRALITCVDSRQLDPKFAGRVFDAELLRELPETVDPLGEKGEFHSFAFDGPMFDPPIAVTPGEIVERDGFVFADATLADSVEAE